MWGSYHKLSMNLIYSCGVVGSGLFHPSNVIILQIYEESGSPPPLFVTHNFSNSSTRIKAFRSEMKDSYRNNSVSQ